jgi:hypothetical protein
MPLLALPHQANETTYGCDTAVFFRALSGVAHGLVWTPPTAWRTTRAPRLPLHRPSHRPGGSGDGDSAVMTGRVRAFENLPPTPLVTSVTAAIAWSARSAQIQSSRTDRSISALDRHPAR